MYGRVSVDETNGTITYDHVGSCRISFYSCGSNENDSFTYTVLDDDGKPSNVATVVVNVTNQPDTNALTLESTGALFDPPSAIRGDVSAVVADVSIAGVAITGFIVAVPVYTRLWNR